jgi:KUP system potassium uptake protein
LSEVQKDSGINRITAAGLVITLGIVYGDIGTSPLYVLQAIVGEASPSPEVILGALSCIFWTLTIQTTFKYVFLTLRADNKGEGGIFALYALLRRTKRSWLIIPAIVGGSALLADGIITPPISVSSAIEGLKRINPDIHTVPIIVVILFLLFVFQRFGTKNVGGLFGPVMVVWFFMIGSIGITSLATTPEVLNAFSPYYAYILLFRHPQGFWLLGAVFLCTTGAEALYSDLGHCGRKNIRVTWVFVKTTLILNYFGQGAWLLRQASGTLTGESPFFAMMPSWFLISGIIISTAATVVASQALISGSYTLINEAIRLNFWPKVRVIFPTNARGQLYIPSVNWMLCLGCLGMVFYFRKSENMEAAYGLAIILTMLMTSILLSYYLYLRRYPRIVIGIILSVFLCVEISFLVANLRKFKHGGWLTLLIAACLIMVMFTWFRARRIMNRYTDFVKLKDYYQMLIDLGNDKEIPKYATNLIYLTSANNEAEVESRIIYSVFQKFPKRADLYWLIHVNVEEEPYTMEYTVKELIQNRLIRIDFNLGFRVDPRINLLFRKVVEDLVRNKEVNIISRYESLSKENVIGDFRFVVIERFLSHENDLPVSEELILDIYFLLKHRSLSDAKAFGLDTSSVTVEKAPYIIAPVSDIPLKRIL